MKPFFYFALGIIVGVLAVYSFLPNLDRFITTEKVVYEGADIETEGGEIVKPDTVVPVIKFIDNPKSLSVIDSLQREIVRLYNLKQKEKQLPPLVVRDTVYLDRDDYIVDKVESKALFTYPYADINIIAYGDLPVDHFKKGQSTFYFDRYRRDNNLVPNPTRYFGVTKREWLFFGGGALAVFLSGR